MTPREREAIRRVALAFGGVTVVAESEEISSEDHLRRWNTRAVQLDRSVARQLKRYRS